MLNLLLVIAIVMVGCANSGPPPGGPVDKTPPEIVDVQPLSGTVNVPEDIAVSVTFSEPVKTSNISQAFSLSPPPPGAVRARWKGRKVIFRFDPPLLPDRTYVLTLGTNTQDLHGNPLVETFHLPFSTGDRLDMGWIHGRIQVDGAATGWSIVGYLLTADSLGSEPDPAYIVPDATTQANTNGTWELLHLRGGSWRIFAFKDNDGDRLWTPWSEKLAVPPFDVEVSEDSTFQSRFLTLSPTDRPTLPQLVRVSSTVRTVIEARFDRKPFSLDGRYELAPVPDSLAKQFEATVIPLDAKIPVKDVHFKAGDSSTVQLELASRPEGDLLGVHIAGTFGTGSSLDTTLFVSLLRAAEADTFLPGLVNVLPPANARLHKGNRVIVLTFTKPMATLEKGAIKLIYSVTSDTVLPVIGSPDPWRRSFYVNPTPGGDLQVELLGAKILDANGYAFEDSLRIYRYTLLPVDSLGTVSGTVVAAGIAAPVHLTLISLNGKDQTITGNLDLPGPFRFESVPAGEWKLRGWLDLDRDGHWGMGSPVPYIPSDPVYITADTVVVRARWESGATSFIFP
ncbi:MAG: Ig-like domain-containing protein [bacterium]